MGSVIWRKVTLFDEGIEVDERHMPPKLTPAIINAAIDGFENQKRQIDSQIAGLRGMLDGASSDTAPTTTKRKARKRILSAAARARIGDAQRKRWAATKRQSEPAEPTAAQSPRKKRKMSAAGRRAIAEGTRKRWAAVRAAKAQAEKAAIKAGRKTASKKAAKRARTAAKKTALTEAMPTGQAAG